MSVDTQAVEQTITEKLSQVIDPETGTDVVSMRLVEELTVDETGFVRYTFRPSSPFCPLAIPLAQAIKNAVAAVSGVSGQKIKVENYVAAEKLTEVLNQ
jgi:metal-sulfur cluster biosynthetic enzyme